LLREIEKGHAALRKYRKVKYNDKVVSEIRYEVIG
jgi:hypothetical protein